MIDAIWYSLWKTEHLSLILTWWDVHNGSVFSARVQRMNMDYSELFSTGSLPLHTDLSAPPKSRSCMSAVTADSWSLLWLLSYSKYGGPVSLIQRAVHGVNCAAPYEVCNTLLLLLVLLLKEYFTFLSSYITI